MQIRESVGVLTAVAGRLAQISAEELWCAVKTRDGSYNGRFVFGALSTKIYCRPSCPSKRPSREGVVFFAGPRAAEVAGFRACLRCRPRDEAAPPSNRRIVEAACAFIERNLDGKVTLRVIGEHVAISPFYLQRIFKRIVGITPRQYAEKAKLDRAKLLLKRGESVRRSTYASGHSSTSWLYSNSASMLGMRPSAYKNGGEGMRVSYCITGCNLGRLLVAGTDRGVCAVSLADSDEKLESFLRNEYPKAEIDGDASKLTSWVRRIVNYVDGKEDSLLSELPLDIRATSFKFKVWRELQSIPYGATCSYAEVARRIGSPRASRAVGNACATNPVALIIPCHRVVRMDGDPGGYRWGLDRKRALLKKEAEFIASSS
ncbi:MAG: bifunctional DNA-binding transcriptional regulator/O6-methylguanine-DNA methyltransferase Ada [Thaumarchaeota archaeon]|nr:bifunctional DNA-binding transcriptional regulator/O6-methylguanine-DNA methyltransferase Ada [Nitrososphaerota archaeon]